VDAYILPRVFLLLAGGSVALSLSQLARRGPPGGSLGPLAWPALAVALAAVAALLGSLNFWTSLAGEYLRYESAVVRAGYVLLFCSTVWLLDGERSRRLVVTFFLLGCAVCAVEAAWEWYAYAYGLTWGLARPDGNLGNAGLLGCLLAMAAPLALGRALQAGAGRPAWLLVLVAIAAGLVASTSRSGSVAALGAGALVVAARVPRRWLPLAAAIGACLVLGALALILGPLGSLHSDPLAVRLQLWQRVLPMIGARPFLGWGEDTFGLVFGRYSQGYLPGVTFDRAHSQLLDLAAAQGLAGVAVNGWFWLALAWHSARHGGWRQAERAALLAALAAYWVWATVNFDWAPVTAVAWLLAGVVWSGSAPSPRAAEGRGEGEPQRKPHRRPLRLIGCLLSIGVAVAFGVLPVLADVGFYRGDLRTAVALDPLQARYHHALGEQLVAQGDLPGGAAELRRAGDLGDQDANVWVELGQAETRLGHNQAARDAYARAREIDPAVRIP
jgi:hypothetical protein